MKLITPEISWHQKEPIFSVNFCPQTWKLATGGADSTIKIWLVKEKEDGDNSIGIDFLSNLDRHDKPVNVVRFSPSGRLLASAGDDGTIILWKLNDSEPRSSTDFDSDVANKETWGVHKMFRGHLEDIYDLAWSPNGSYLISGSVDNSAIIWDIDQGQMQKVLKDHKHYVQGVCWDPQNSYVVTHSSDKTCRLYSTANHKCIANIHKNDMFYEKDGQLVKTKTSRMFLDETMRSFFRRCTFSPDGSYLFLPAGVCDGDEKVAKTTYVFERGHFKQPIYHLPGGKKATVCVRCCPVVYDALDDKENHIPEKLQKERLNVPYRMIYAVASLEAVTIYDTQHNFPIGYCANMHYASLTDLAWSSDGKLLVISSTDGYCSFIKFEEGELGKPIEYDPIQFQITQAAIRKKAKKESKKKEKNDSIKDSDKNNASKSTSSPQENIKEKEKEKSHDEKKEKIKVDSKQPTIEKLFVTPVRKRKRNTESSPNEPNSSKIDNGNKVGKIDANSKILNNVKPPKRVQVISLLENDQKKPIIPPNLVPSLPGDKNEGPCSKILKPLTVQTGACNDITSPQGKIPNPLTSPNRTPKRVTVTTLATTNVEKTGGGQLLSPNIPKRVSVTTLSTFNEGSSKSEQGLLSPVHSHVSPVNKSITPSKSICSPISPIPKNASLPKQPKRITVQTLETFTAAKEIALEDEDTPISNIPVQVDPPQLDDMLSTNSFDAPLIDTSLNNLSIEEDTSKSESSGKGSSKEDSIVID